MIRIQSKKDGFRRCGIAHPARPTEYDTGVFSKAQLKALRAEPMLLVEEVPDSEGLTGEDGQAVDEIPVAKKPSGKKKVSAEE